MMRPSRFLLLATCVVAGCAPGQSVMRPANDLDRAIRYKEVTRNSEYSLSMSSNVFGVPSRAEVDINSIIEIDIDTTVVHLPGGPVTQEISVPSKDRAEAIRAALDSLAKVIEAREATIRAYQAKELIPLAVRAATPQDKAYKAARRVSNDLSIKFLQLPLWTDGSLSSSVQEINAAFDSDPDTYRALGPIIQKELDAITASLKQTVNSTKESAATFKLGAFLRPPKGDPSALHLRNYDSIDQKNPIIKNAFMVDQQDLDRLNSQWAETNSVVSAVNNVRSGKASINGTLQTLGLSQVADLSSSAEKVERLLNAWSVKDFADSLKRAARQIGDAAKGQGNQDLDALASKLKAADSSAFDSIQIDKIKTVAAGIKGLGADWRNAPPDSLPILMAKSQKALGQVAGTMGDLSKLKLDPLTEAASSVLSLARGDIKSIPFEVQGQLADALSSSGTLSSLQSMTATIAALDEFKEKAEALINFLGASKPVGIDIQATSQDVSWANAPNTKIELQSANRSIGDEVLVTGILDVNDQEFARTEASFSVQQFGWHKDLTPSVVLARPIRTTSSFDRDFKFAPAVSWLETYYPRPTDDRVLSRAARFSQLGVGLHAVYLNQDTQTNAEIGLGFAASCFRDFVTAGLGWNMMSDRRPYFYIGSNLIPILQALGYGNGAQAGKTP